MTQVPKSKITIWDCCSPIPIKEDSPVIFNLDYVKPPIPKTTEERVNKNWEFFKEKRLKKNQYAVDNDVAYVVSFDIKGNKRIFNGFRAGYSYNQWLNRDDKKEIDRKTAYRLSFNGIGTWMIPTCNQGKTIFFGNRKDLAKKMISSLGGYIRAERDSINGEISIAHHIENNLKDEFGKLSSFVKNVSYIGLTFCPNQNFKSLCPSWGYSSFNLNCIIDVNLSLKEIKKSFGNNEQFSKDIIFIKSEPDCLMQFLEDIRKRRIPWEISTSEELGILNYIGSIWGQNKMKEVISEYSRGDMIKILNPSGKIEFF